MKVKTLTHQPTLIPSGRIPASASPFANSAPLDELRNDLDINVAKGERLASTLLGLALMSAGHYLRRKGGLFRRVIAAMLISRGATGHCPLYYVLGKDTRHYGKGAAQK